MLILSLFLLLSFIGFSYTIISEDTQDIKESSFFFEEDFIK